MRPDGSIRRKGDSGAGVAPVLSGAMDPSRPATSRHAAASLTFGILGVLLSCCAFGVPSLLAVVTGHLAIREIKSSGRSGRGLATAGLILGYTLLIPAVALSIRIVPTLADPLP